MNAPSPMISGREESLASSGRFFGSLSRRVLLYLAWVALTCLLFLNPLRAFVSYSLSNDDASHVVLIPFLSAWMLYLERERTFKALSSDVARASVFFAAGLALAFLAFLAGSHSS